MIAGYMPISVRQRLRHSSHWQTLGIVVLMLVVASIPLMIAYGALAAHQALKVEWAIDGPACPVVSKTVRYHRPPQAFSYQGVRFTRQYGSVYCVVVPDGGVLSSAHHTACQFNAPAAVSVTTARRSILYEPGIGHVATVTIRDGQPSCVIGGWFTY
jgi:hypothetical protein